MKIDVCWMREEQLDALKKLTADHNRVIGDSKTPEQMLNSMMFVGFDQWFEERLRDMRRALSVMEVNFGARGDKAR